MAGTGGTGTAPPSSDVFYLAFSAQPIVDNIGPFTNGSLVFGGWNTSTLGTGISYPAGSTVTMTANITLYAQWINPAISYTLTYDENSAAGGSGIIVLKYTVTPPSAIFTYSNTGQFIVPTGVSQVDYLVVAGGGGGGCGADIGAGNGGNGGRGEVRVYTF